MKQDIEKLVREFGSEENMARRIKGEMARRGWSQARLAKEMAAAGYPIHQSAISKIISPAASDRRRTISVDEALAFAKTLGLELPDLLVPEEQLMFRRVGPLILQGKSEYETMSSAERALENVLTELGQLAIEDPVIRNLIGDLAEEATAGKTGEELVDSINAQFLLRLVERVNKMTREEKSDGE